MMRALSLLLLFCAATAFASELERADQPRSWAFPADHAAHPAFGTEWWYFTGSVRDAGGDRYGFELTFFRVAMRPDSVASTSAWRARDLILAHVAVTDVTRDAFVQDEAMQRAAAGLAGARGDRFQVWAGAWSAEQEDDGFHLRAQSDAVGLDLALDGDRLVLHGRNGRSQKSRDGSMASYYYSMPRLDTVGTLRVGSRQLSVRGTTWMDHEFFTGPTPAEGIGWDWFGVRLDDGRDLMLVTVRQPDGEPFSLGTLVQADGTGRLLDLDGLQVEPLERWTSPTTGTRYPIAWTIHLPVEAITLQARAAVAGQEIVARRSVGFAYWEGLTDFQGTAAGRSVRGEGYVELTGY